MSSKLLKLNVQIKISDPWEFGTECGTGPFKGKIVEVGETKFLILLNKAIIYKGVSFIVIVATLRHEGIDIEKSKPQKQIALNMILSTINKLSEYQKNSNHDFVPVIGTMEIE